jgi:glycerol uptake facilitator-like aquaporin
MKLNKYLAEFLGTATLLIAVVGSSFMAEDLTQDKALALTINALVTAAVLAIIIKGFLNTSGSHFNPAVSIALAVQGKLEFKETIKYLLAQIFGGIAGVILANSMFSESVISLSDNIRSGHENLIGEFVATSGLIALALFAGKKLVWKLIPLWIFGAYFFTVSTSFANPAVTIARFFTDAPAGIALESVLAFVFVQMITAILVVKLIKEK